MTAPMPSRPRGDLFAKFMGFLVMAAGLAVIAGVLWLAWSLFQDPFQGTRAVDPKKGPDAVEIGMGFGRLLVRIGLLFLASICGSLIANKGIHLYFAGAPARHTRDDALPGP